MVDSILVSVDFPNKNDTGVMVVGRKRMNQSVEIINAFQGDEARELYERLITTKKKEGQLVYFSSIKIKPDIELM